MVALLRKAVRKHKASEQKICMSRENFGVLEG
jgi:hypothetical protein